MKAQLIARAVGLGAVMVFLSCGGPSGVVGKGGDWTKGKALSLKATLTGKGVVLEFRNESAKGIDLTPFGLTVWGKKTGRQELQLSTEGSEPDTKVKMKHSGAGGIGMALQLSLPTGPGFTLKLDPYPYGSAEWSPLGEGDATKVRVVVGPEGSKEQEIFTVSF